jgi:hypothetical protein
MIWLERAKIGEELLSVLKIFPQLLRLLINVNRNAARQRNGMEIATFLPISCWAILPPLLLADSR